MRGIPQLKATLLRPVRRGREIAWMEPWMGLGNYLSLGHWAFSGKNRYLLRHASMPLLDLFPTFAGRFLISADRVRFTDQRVKPWRNKEPFTWQSITDFINMTLLPDCPLISETVVSPDALVVNVRRGDYYSDPGNRAQFGMNIVGYVTAAVARSFADDGTSDHIMMVSDDPEWCRASLGPLLSSFAPVKYLQGKEPAQDLSALIHARRLVVANSTFSHWGGYIGDEIHPGRAVYAPQFFSREHEGERNHTNRPEWTVIDKIPGGWDNPDAPPPAPAL